MNGRVAALAASVVGGVLAAVAPVLFVVPILYVAATGRGPAASAGEP